MKILKIDHVGIAVNSITTAKGFWSDVLGLHFDGIRNSEQQRVAAANLSVGESEIELLESTSYEGTVAKYIKRHGEGIHHVAFQVADIETALTELQENGIQLINEKPIIGASGGKIAFLHPKATGGILVELCERES